MVLLYSETTRFSYALPLLILTFITTLSKYESTEIKLPQRYILAIFLLSCRFLRALTYELVYISNIHLILCALVTLGQTELLSY